MPNYKKELIFASWNVENLFDTKDDPKKDDRKYLPPKWTMKKLNKKLKNMTDVIKDISPNGPDILALQEIENINVLNYWIDEFMPDLKYQTIILEEAADPRGIDVALISKYPVYKYESHYQTRGSRSILEVILDIYGNKLAIFNVHHKSRRGDAKKTKAKRIKQSSILSKKVTKSIKQNDLSEIIITGDFNDEPNNQSLKMLRQIDNYSFFNLLESYFKGAKNNKEIGTCYYSKTKRWYTFDNMFVSCGLIEYLCRQEKKGLSIDHFKANVYTGDMLKKLKKDHRQFGLRLRY